MHDLSLVTDQLRKIVTDAIASSAVFGGVPPPFSVNVSGQHPQTPTGGSDTELSLYLFHVAGDKYLANSFWSQAAQGGGGGGQTAGRVRATLTGPVVHAVGPVAGELPA